MPPIIAAYLPISPIYIHLVVLQMGGYFSSIIEWASFGKHAQILILGLDASGKTTIINRLKTGTHAVTVPTIGFNSETIEFNNLTFHAWDIGGQDSIRKLWHHYYPNTDGVVFIVDSRQIHEAVSAGTTRVARTNVQSPPKQYPIFNICK